MFEGVHCDFKIIKTFFVKRNSALTTKGGFYVCSQVFRFILIFVVFLVVYLPIALNPKIFERKSVSSVSYIIENDIVSANIIDY